MKLLPFGFHEWIGDARKYWRADLIASFTLLALIVPESVAHAELALAPTPMAGIYGLIIILPIYALFASSRYVVATSTAAVSATMAGFIGVMAGEAANSFSLLVMATALAYLVFYFLKLGFVTNFISEPVSRGFMFGLAAFIIVDQSSKLFGVKSPEGDTFLQIFEIAKQLPQANWICFALGIFCFAILSVSKRISEKMPGGLVAMFIMILIFKYYGPSANWGVEMVGALPKGLPDFRIPTLELTEVVKVISAAAGIVILGSSESQVLAEKLASQHDQEVNGDQQFFAFGISNFVASFFGSHLSSGSTSSTVVDHEAGARTLMSTVWASLGALLTALFLTGIFAYVPDVFLGVLIIHALIHLLNPKEILQVKKYSRNEYLLALCAALAVMIFGVLDGLILTMLINVVYLLGRTANIKLGEFKYTKESGYVHLPADFKDVDLVSPAKDVLMVGATQGVLYYVSAPDFVDELRRILKKYPDAKTIVISFSRTNELDFTSMMTAKEMLEELLNQGKTIYITDYRNTNLARQLETLNALSDKIIVRPHLDISKLK